MRGEFLCGGPENRQGEFGRGVGMNSRRMRVSGGRAMRRGRMSSDVNSAGISGNGRRNLMGRVWWNLAGVRDSDG